MGTPTHMSPEQVVADLYRQHKKKSPFFQNKSRLLVDRYFEKTLADLNAALATIAKNARLAARLLAIDVS